MNAKKIVSILTLASAATLILAACGGSGTSSNNASSSGSPLTTNAQRTNAEGILDAMTSTVTASGYVSPAKYDIAYQASTTFTGAIHFSSTDNFLYAKAVGTTVDYSKNTITWDTEAWAFKDGAKYIVAIHKANSNTYAEIDATVFATLTKAYADKATSTITASPAAFSKFLKNFDKGTQSTVTVNGSSQNVILAGGSSSSLWMKSEAYASTGAGNLTATLTIGRTYGDEPIVYSWGSSRIQSEVNSANSTSEAFTWDSSTANALSNYATAYTVVTDATVITTMVTAAKVVAGSF